MTTLSRSIAALFAVAGLVLLGTPALADARLEKSDPADGASLTAVPAAVTLTFNEPVNPQSVTLTGPDGQPVVLGEVTKAQAVVTQPLPALANGAYALAFKVVSTDGHNVSGTVKFTVAAPAPTTTTTTTTATQAPVVTSAPAVQNQAAESSSSTWWIVGGVVAVVALALVAGLLIRRRRA